MQKNFFFWWNILNHGLSWLFPVMSIILFLCTMYFHPNYFSYWSFSFQLHSLQTSLEAFDSWLCLFLVSVTTLNFLFYLWTRLLLICLKEKILPPFLLNIMARATAIAEWQLTVKWLKDDSDQTGLPGWHGGKEPACQCRRRRSLRFDPWVGTTLWRRKWQPSPVFLPGKRTEGPGGLQSMGLQRVAQVSGTEHALTDQTIATFSPLSTRGRIPRAGTSQIWALGFEYLGVCAPYISLSELVGV